jgi:hypothetical protein
VGSRLAYKYCTVTNALAYYRMKLITAVKSLILQPQKFLEDKNLAVSLIILANVVRQKVGHSQNRCMFLFVTSSVRVNLSLFCKFLLFAMSFKN